MSLHCIYYKYMTSTTIQIRIDEKTKREAKKVFAELGLDISSATKLFYKKALATKSIPFEVRTENGFTLSQEREIIRESKWLSKHGKKFKNVGDLIKDLNS